MYPDSHSTQKMLKEKAPELWGMIAADMPNDVPDGNYSFRGDLAVAVAV
jgi:hypothetical protein